MSEDMYQVSRILSAFLTYILVLIRCGTLVLFAPFLSSEVFSNQIRLCFAAVFPLLLISAASRTAQVPQHMDMMQFFILAGQEFTVGMAISFVGSLVFSGMQLAGEIMGQQIGFSMSSVMDPQTDIEVPMLSFLNINLAMALFIISKLHLVIIWIMWKSYEYVGIGAMMPDVNFNNPVLEGGLEGVRVMMILGVRMAMPIILIMMMNNVVNGFITKTMPQMNIQVLGMPLKIATGLVALIFVYPAICMLLIPADWRFNLLEMPEGPLGSMLLDLSNMVAKMGAANQ